MKGERMGGLPDGMVGWWWCGGMEWNVCGVMEKRNRKPTDLTLTLRYLGVENLGRFCGAVVGPKILWWTEVQ
jgi:hypothetical protein